MTKNPPAKKTKLQPPALLDWAAGHPAHLETAAWLLSVHGVSTLSKPRFQALETLLIDVKTHGPELLFNLAAVMLKAVPPAFATAEERAAYRNAVGWLSLTPGAEETAP